MKTKKLTRGKVIMSIMLALVLAGGFFLLGDKAFAAGGTISVDVANQGNWPKDTEFTFNLYKVGEYAHDADGKAVFALDRSLEGSGVGPTLATAANYDKGTDEAAWTRDWLNTANSLATFINGMTEGKPEVKGTQTVRFGESGEADPITFSVNENGLYLLIGSSEDIGDLMWTPQPMFISVLNGDKTISYNNEVGVKMTSKKIAHEHSLLKTWEGDSGLEEYLQPEKVAVKIMHGSTQKSVEVDTVILEKGKDGTPDFYYTWKDKVHYGSGADAKSEDDDEIENIDYIVVGEDGKDTVERNFEPVDPSGDWFVVELRGDEAKTAFINAGISEKDASEYVKKLDYYKPDYGTTTVSEDAERLDIINTYTYKQLKLTKKIDGYDEDGDDVAFSFLIEGFDGPDGTGNKIYTNHLGVVFTKSDYMKSDQKTVDLKYIPSAVKSIKITEEYSGNYTLVKPIEVKPLEATTESDTGEGNEQAAATEAVAGWQATAENKHTGHGPKGGVVNQYRHDKDKPNKVGPEETPTSAEGEE